MAFFSSNIFDGFAKGVSNKYYLITNYWMNFLKLRSYFDAATNHKRNVNED